MGDTEDYIENCFFRSRGFGFITFSKASMVDSVQGARPHIIDKREVETKRATPKDVSKNDRVTCELGILLYF